MRSFPTPARTAAEKRLRLAAILLPASVPLALLLIVLISGGQPREELSRPRSLALFACELWIPVALIATAAPLRRLAARREKARKTLVCGLLYDLRNSDDFTLFSVAFHPGCGTARCLLRRDSAAFSAEEEDYADSRWTPTGRAWQAESEAALWQKLAEEGYTEVAWREDDSEAEQTPTAG